MLDTNTGFVLVIGAAGMDVKGTPLNPLTPKASNPGRVRRSFGGVARNIAENLARLEIQVALLTAIGDDFYGERIITHGRESGIIMDYIRRCPEARSGSYIAVQDADGDLAVAVSDYEIMHYIDPSYLDSQKGLFEQASMLVLDLNLMPESLNHALNLAESYGLPVVVDPTSPIQAAKLCAYLDRLYLVAPNAAETTTLCGLEIPAHDLHSAVAAARHLISMGTEIAIVTLGDQGLAYADSKGSGHIPSVKAPVVDSTGAGDALTAGVLFGLLNDLPLDEAMRLGVTAASLTLQSQESVAPHLTPDLLYNSLVV